MLALVFAAGACSSDDPGIAPSDAEAQQDGRRTSDGSSDLPDGTTVVADAAGIRCLEKWQVTTDAVGSVSVEGGQLHLSAANAGLVGGEHVSLVQRGLVGDFSVELAFSMFERNVFQRGDLVLWLRTSDGARIPASAGSYGQDLASPPRFRVSSSTQSSWHETGVTSAALRLSRAGGTVVASASQLDGSPLPGLETAFEISGAMADEDVGLEIRFLNSIGQTDEGIGVLIDFVRIVGGGGAVESDEFDCP